MVRSVQLQKQLPELFLPELYQTPHKNRFYVESTGKTSERSRNEQAEHRLPPPAGGGAPPPPAIEKKYYNIHRDST
jgi:hypothetical protein